MKVLLTATVQSHICQFHRPLVEVLHEHNYEVHVAARNNLAEKNGLKLDFVEKVYDIPFSRSPLSRDNNKAYRQLKKIIASGRYDVVHCNTPMGGIVTRLAAHGARNHGTKVYYTAHGFHFYRGAPKKNWLIFFPIEKAMAHLTDKLVTITGEDYKLASKRFACPVMRTHGVGVRTEKFDFVSDQEALQFREENGWGNNYFILCTGELNRNKNQGVLIKAMPQILEKLPNAKLLLAGNGPQEQSLKTLIWNMGLEKSVYMLGYRTDLEWYVRACNVVVSASMREGLPVNVLEAMYCGKPVVVSENRGHRELVKDRVNGFLVEPEDVKGFADRVVRLAKNEQLRERFSLEGKRRVKGYLDVAVKKEYMGVYELN